MSGNCFEVAQKVALDAYLANPAGSLWIVHGLPVGRGDDNLGLRYWHAWVEVVPDNSAPLVMCVDRSNGLDIAMPKAQYYALGNLNRNWVWRFTLPEALRTQVLLEHGGPWVYGSALLEEVRL